MGGGSEDDFFPFFTIYFRWGGRPHKNLTGEDVLDLFDLASIGVPTHEES